jgi:hypothetical protein
MPSFPLKLIGSFSKPPDLELLRPVRVICVPGTRRSGTSRLTGALRQAGLELGEHQGREPPPRAARVFTQLRKPVD